MPEYKNVATVVFDPAGWPWPEDDNDLAGQWFHDGETMWVVAWTKGELHVVDHDGEEMSVRVLREAVESGSIYPVAVRITARRVEP